MLTGTSASSKFHRAPRCGLLRLGLLILVVTAGGCVHTGPIKQIEKLDSASETADILVMTPDVRYYELTASGVPELQPQWTDSARTHFAEALIQFANDNRVQIKNLPEQSSLTDLEISYQKLYSAVGSTILRRYYGEINLPTKKDNFDWTLGPGVAAIGEKYGADYALFTYYREWQASGGRMALSFFAALAGVGLVTGGEIGFASLIDLRTGDIVWFNKLTPGTGELRDPESARQTVDKLLRYLPSKA